MLFRNSTERRTVTDDRHCSIRHPPTSRCTTFAPDGAQDGDREGMNIRSRPCASAMHPSGRGTWRCRPAAGPEHHPRRLRWFLGYQGQGRVIGRATNAASRTDDVDVSNVTATCRTFRVQFHPRRLQGRFRRSAEYNSTDPRRSPVTRPRYSLSAAGKSRSRSDQHVLAPGAPRPNWSTHTKESCTSTGGVRETGAKERARRDEKTEARAPAS